MSSAVHHEVTTTTPSTVAAAAAGAAPQRAVPRRGDPHLEVGWVLAVDNVACGPQVQFIQTDTPAVLCISVIRAP